MVIIGNRIMQQYYTIFETSQNRVGFSIAANCSGAQYKVKALSGDGQRGVVGKKLKHPLVIQVQRMNDSAPVAGINVTFNVVDTTAPVEMTWIAHSIWKGQPASVEVYTVTTSAEGLAETHLWLAGSAGTSTVTVDVPLCLKHVVFTALGQQSVLWSVLTYLFVFILIVAVILLNVWLRKNDKRRKIPRLDLSTANLDIHKLSIQSPDDSSDNLSLSSYRPLSPTSSSYRSDKLDNTSDNSTIDNESTTNNDDEEDDETLQYGAPRRWFQSLKRKLNRSLWRTRYLFSGNSSRKFVQ